MSLSLINGGRGPRTGAELFCQEFMPVTTPLFCKYSENIKRSRWHSILAKFPVLVFNRGGKSAICRRVCSNRKDCEKVTGAEAVPALLITGKKKYGGGRSHLL